MNRVRRYIPHLVFVCLLVPVAVLSYLSVSKDAARRSTGGSSLQSQYDSHDRIAQGEALIDAIYKYRNTVGLWPLTLRDALEMSGGGVPPLEWQYEWQHTGEWSLVYHADFPHSLLRYRHEEAKSEWTFFSGAGEDPSDIRAGIPRKLEPLSSFSRTIPAEIERRVNVDRERHYHLQYLAAYSSSNKSYSQALAACDAGIRMFPQIAWFQLYKADVLLRLNRDGDAFESLAAWCKPSENAMCYYLSAWYLIEHDRTKNAVSLVRDARGVAVKEGVVVHRCDSTNSLCDDYILAMCSMSMYRHREYDSALQLCEKWQQFVTESYRHGDRSYHAIQCACYVNLGKYPQAAESLQQANNPKFVRRMWAENLEDLRAAIATHDSHYAYDIPFVKSVALAVLYQ